MRTGPVAMLLLALAPTTACNDDAASATAPRGDSTDSTDTTTAPLAGLHPTGPTPGAGTQTPNLFGGPDGTLVLTWVEPVADAFRLQLALRDAAGWSEARTVMQGPLMANWADFPAAAIAADGTLVAAWPVPTEPGYGLQWSRSIDEGRTWSSPQWLHEDVSGPEYGFVSMTPVGPDALALFWVDGRHARRDGGFMQLRTATIGRQGPPRARAVVDDRICDCCQTSAVTTHRGPRVAYRDRTVDEIRDIWIAGPREATAAPIHRDGWKINGCPVNGPSLAATDRSRVAAWYTGAHEQPAVHVAFASGDAEFGAPVRVDRGHPLGRVSIVAVDPGTAVVTFLEQQPEAADRAMVLTRRVEVDGTMGPAYVVATTSAARGSGFPRTARFGDRIVYAWTELDGETKRVHVAEVPSTTLRPSS